MPLDEYRRKRRFDSTTEPSGETDGTGGARFVVQKHAARRLHYDLRLELDGVLRSWAVPKGPSLDPGERRLAVQVEDHPLEYAGFEGVIPQGEYGAGSVIVWDTGEWRPLGGGGRAGTESRAKRGGPISAEEARRHLSEGHLKFELAGQKLAGAWVLVRMKRRDGEERDNWLLIKERDERSRPLSEYDVLSARPESVITGKGVEDVATAAEGPDAAETPAPEPRRTPRVLDASSIGGARRVALPRGIDFQLAVGVATAPEGDEWLHEIKLDGYRVRSILVDGEARMLTRNGADWTDRFGALASAIESIGARSAVLDGEVVSLDRQGASDFGALRRALSEGGPLTYMVFDLLYLDGYDLRAAPLLERKGALARLLSQLPAEAPLRYVDHVIGLGEQFRRAACTYALEGVVSKRADRPHYPGRNRDWLKSKCLKRQEFVVGGFTRPSGARTGFGALLLGAYDADSLLYVGRVGSGFPERTLRDLQARLKGLRRETPPFANPPSGSAARDLTWTHPELVVEVSFVEWTDGGLLRQPVFRGLREDKSPREVVVEPPTGPSEGAPPSPSEASPAASRAAHPQGLGKVRLTHPDKVLYAGVGLTKRKLAEYYAAVAEWMLPHVEGRLLTLMRCPQGSEGACFYQKHVEDAFPSAVRRLEVPVKAGSAVFAYIDSLEGLLALVQMGTLEIHLWGSRIEDVEQPDRLIWDLDPGPGVDWADVARAALDVRERLDSLGLRSFLKTTGGKGLHVVAPITRRTGWTEARAFARSIAEGMATSAPDRYTAKMSKALRPGKVFVDYVRNAREATAVAPYSTRARHGAPVATPIFWEELDPALDPSRMTVASVPERLAGLSSDPWAELTAVRQTLPGAAKPR